MLEVDRSFVPKGSEEVPHKATEGHTTICQLAKLVRYIFMKANDIVSQASHEPIRDTAGLKITKINPVYRFLDITKNSKAGMFARDNVLIFADVLGKKFGNKDVKFVPHGIGPNKVLGQADPLMAICGYRPKELAVEENVDGDWCNIEDSEPVDARKGRIKKYDQRMIVYPFVYPSNGIFSFAHIVLIVVDQKKQKIFYYDSQGLTSDDLARSGLFEDRPDFDMHTNLTELAGLLFEDAEGGVVVVENNAQHQIDPVNCGTFVLRAIHRLYLGMEVEEALSFDSLEEDISEVRRELGLIFFQYLWHIKK